MAKRNPGSKKRTVRKNSPTADAAGFCVYLGPTIMGVIQNGTVYRGNKQDALAEVAAAVKKYPLIASLIVTGDTLAVDRIKVKTPGNLLYVNCRKLMQGIM